MEATGGHRLAAVLREAAAGRFPAVDGRVDVLPSERGRHAGRRRPHRSRLHPHRPFAQPGDVVFAHVAPGNAASVQMFLRSGFVPLGSEVLFEPG